MPDVTISTAALRVVKLLVGRPPQTIADLIKITKVTRTAVTEQLNELVAAGFVERSTERLPGRGRPRHLYRATHTCLSMLFTSNQRLLVPAVWQAIHAVGGDKLAKEVLKRVSGSLADHYNRQVTGREPRQRLRQLIALLRAEGGLVEAVEQNGHLVMHKRSCPFISMLDEKRSVCCVDQEMMNLVVGQAVRRTACRHEGAPCCTFEIAQQK
jgi:predicted ArsR family transcriptional regulator